MSNTLLLRYEARANYLAERCAQITTDALLTGNNALITDVMKSLEPMMRERDALRQQIAWMNRRTAWAAPKEPAWQD